MIAGGSGTGEAIPALRSRHIGAVGGGAGGSGGSGPGDCGGGGGGGSGSGGEGGGGGVGAVAAGRRRSGRISSIAVRLSENQAEV